MDNRFIMFGQTDLQFKVIQMPPDGSCLFHSISYSVYGNNFYSNQTREKIVNYVSTDWAKFQILTHDVKGDNYISPEHYRHEMLKPSTYGSACELIAASELFQCMFRVYHNGRLLQSFGVDGTATEYHLLFTGNLSSGHFDVLASNHEKAPEMPPKQGRKTVSQCTKSEVLVNFEHGTEEPKAKRLKQKAISQPAKTSIRIEDILQEEKEELEHVNQNTNFQSNDNYLENMKSENTAKEDNKKSKKKRTKRKRCFSNLPRLKQLREAAAKYKITHPEVNKAAVAKYTKKNPEVNRAAAAKYTEKNPEVNRAAAAKYTEKNPEVNRAAAAKYTEQNPEVHRAAAAKYTEKNPEVHRAAAAKYTEQNPEVNRVAVAAYTKKNPGVNRAAVSKYDKTHEKRKQRKNKMWTLNANTGFQYDPDICYEPEERTICVIKKLSRRKKTNLQA